MQGNLFQEAIGFYKQQRFQEAEQLCRELLAKNSQDANTINLLGLLSQNQNQHGQAVAYFSEASEKSPSEASFYHNAALSYYSINQMDSAIASLKKALQYDAKNAEYLFNAAVMQAHDSNAAIQCLNQLLEITPDDVNAINLLISHLLKVNDKEAALALAKRSILQITDNASLYFNLGLLLTEDQADEAIVHYKKALQCDVRFIKAHVNLAGIYFQQGDLSAAMDHYKQVNQLDPQNIEGWTNLCSVYLREFRTAEALATIRSARKLHLHDEQCLFSLSQCLAQTPPNQYDDFLAADYLACLGSPNMAFENLLMAGEFVLWQYLQALLQLDDLSSSESLHEHLIRLWTEQRWQLDDLNHPLVVKTLTLLPLRSLRMENLFMALRQFMAERLVASSLDSKESSTVFLMALAEQCFHNEYVYSYSTAEAAIVEALRSEVESALAQEKIIGNPAQLALLACYIPLYQLENAGQLLKVDSLRKHIAMNRLLLQQVTEPLAEADNKPCIQSLTSIENATSKHVQQQYENNPYPRWQHYTKPKATTLQAFASKKFPWLAPLPIVDGRPEYLVAGSGTGRETIELAMRFPEANITAIDLSLSSLAYAIRKSDELNIKNISWRHADILQLADWARRFDAINSMGVLHHLFEPMQGWKVLARLLKKGGIMNVGLYSEQARQPIIAARQFIQDGAYPATAQDIRQCRQDLIALPKRHPAKNCIHLYGDFFALSNCKDLLFHVQEHCYTLSMLKDTLQTVGLNFLAMVPEEEHRHAFGEKYGSEALTGIQSLDLWRQYECENPHAFLTMYQFWLHNPLDPAKIKAKL